MSVSNVRSSVDLPEKCCYTISSRYWVSIVLIVCCTALVTGEVTSNSTSPLSDSIDTNTIQRKGQYFNAYYSFDQSDADNFLTFQFHSLRQRVPWCMFMVELDHSIDLSGEGRIELSFDQMSDDFVVKIELRDQNSADRVNRSAWRRVLLSADSDGVISLPGSQPFDALNPFGWQRRMLWPDWQSIRYIGVMIESRYNQAENGSIRLHKIEYVSPKGQRHELEIPFDRTLFLEYTPPKKFLKQSSFTSPITDLANQPIANTDEEIYASEVFQDPEATETIKRDDPATALFPSGAGFKLDLDPGSTLGINARAILREELHRIDALLINDVRKTFSDPGFDPRAMIIEPIQVRNASGEIIFDIPDRTDTPRITFSYEDVQVDSQSAIDLDFRLQVHEFSLLWTTPYLDDDRRYRITFEPIYQYFRTTTDRFDPCTRRDNHRGLLNVVFHDEWEQRQFFFQVLFGKANHRDVDLDEIQEVYRAEWRQWYGPEKTAFSTFGIIYSVNDSQSLGRSEDRSRDVEIFGNLIMELDLEGRWRWFSQIKFNQRDIDIFLSVPAGSTNRLYDFYRIENRLIYEAVNDVDLSFGLEHDMADRHDFDSISLVARASVFGVGSFRTELGARHTRYYNLDDELTTFFFELNFAR